MIIFEDNSIVLHHFEGDTDYIIISFAPYGETAKAKETFFLDKIVKKYNISCLGITTKVDNYYLCEDMEQVIILCNTITNKYKKIIIIGWSMGGYAGLKYSKKLNANIVFAMAPRVTIDQEICSLLNYISTKDFPSNEIKKSTLQKSDIQGKIYLAYDQYSPLDLFDKQHITFLQNIYSEIVNIYTCFSNHSVINSLQGSEKFKSIIDALVSENDQNIIQTITYIRRHHINNVIAKINFLMNKYPLFIYKMIKSYTFSKVENNHILLNDPKFSLRLSFLLNQQGYQQESCDCLKSNFFYYVLKIPYNKTPTILPQNIYPYLINFHGYYLGYNFITKKIQAMLNVADQAFTIPIQLYKNNGKVKLICILNGIIFKLQYCDSQLFNMLLLSDENFTQDIKLSFFAYNIFIHSINKKLYISVSPEGEITTAGNPLEWESFTMISMYSPEQMIFS